MLAVRILPERAIGLRETLERDDGARRRLSRDRLERSLAEKRDAFTPSSRIAIR